METKNNKELLMEYLYDEMTADEKKNFEEFLSSNPEIQAELDLLRNIRTTIKMKDEEVVDPFIYAESGSVSLVSIARIVSNVMLKPAIGLAAGISLFLLIGYFTQLNVSTEKGNFSIAFGTQDQSVDFVSEEKFNGLQKEFAAYQMKMEDKINGIKKDIDIEDLQVTSLTGETLSDQKVEDIYNRISSQNSEQFYLLVSRLQKDNSLYMEKYFQTANVNQERMLESILVDFSTFLRDQREEDLRNIQLSLATLNDKQDLQIQETNEVLASIINTVNSQNN